MDTNHWYKISNKKHKQLCTTEEIFCENFDQKKNIYRRISIWLNLALSYHKEVL